MIISGSSSYLGISTSFATTFSFGNSPISITSSLTSSSFPISPYKKLSSIYSLTNPAHLYSFVTSTFSSPPTLIPLSLPSIHFQRIPFTSPSPSSPLLVFSCSIITSASDLQSVPRTGDSNGKGVLQSDSYYVDSLYFSSQLVSPIKS